MDAVRSFFFPPCELPSLVGVSLPGAGDGLEEDGEGEVARGGEGSFVGGGVMVGSVDGRDDAALDDSWESVNRSFVGVKKPGRSRALMEPLRGDVKGLPPNTEPLRELNLPLREPLWSSTRASTESLTVPSLEDNAAGATFVEAGRMTPKFSFVGSRPSPSARPILCLRLCFASNVVVGSTIGGDSPEVLARETEERTGGAADEPRCRDPFLVFFFSGFTAPLTEACVVEDEAARRTGGTTVVAPEDEPGLVGRLLVMAA